MLCSQRWCPGPWGITANVYEHGEQANEANDEIRLDEGVTFGVPCCWRRVVYGRRRRLRSPSPSRRATASSSELRKLSSRTTLPGVPLVLVSPDSEAAEWWVQPLAQPTEPGRYVVAAHFGNSTTPQGTPFHLMVLMVPSDRDAKLMAEQQVFKQLPTGLAMSEANSSTSQVRRRSNRSACE